MHQPSLSLAPHSAYQGVLSAGDVWHIHVVGGWAQIFQLLASEDVDGNKMDFGVTVLAGLGSRHADDLAGTALDNNQLVLAKSRALLGSGQRGTGASLDEVMIMLQREKKSATNA